MQRHRGHAKIMLLFDHAVCDVTWRVGGNVPRRLQLSGANLCILGPDVEYAMRWRERANVAAFYISRDILQHFSGIGSSEVQVQDLALLSGCDAVARHLVAVFNSLCDERERKRDENFLVNSGRVLSSRLLKAHIEVTSKAGRDGRLSAARRQKLANYFEANLNRSVGIEELAKLVFLSPAHFTRLYTESYGEPPVRHHIRRRLHRAEEFLLRTDGTILAAVERFGFGDQSQFSKLFLKYLKYRPGSLLRLREKLPKNEHLVLLDQGDCQPSFSPNLSAHSPSGRYCAS